MYCRSLGEGTAALWLVAMVAAPVQWFRKTSLQSRRYTVLQSGPDLLALAGEDLAADLLDSLSAGSRLPSLLAEKRQSTQLEGRGDIRVGLAVDATLNELHELSTQDVERAGGQADAVAAPGNEVAGLDLEKVIQVHVALAGHLHSFLELQERLVGARCRLALLHRQVLAVVFPGARVLPLDSLLAERCHLEASGNLLAVLTLVDVPDHGGVTSHLVVDVGLLLKQRGGVGLGAEDLRPVNESRDDVRAVEMLAKFRRYCQGINVLTELEVRPVALVTTTATRTRRWPRRWRPGRRWRWTRWKNKTRRPGMCRYERRGKDHCSNVREMSQCEADKGNIPGEFSRYGIEGTPPWSGARRFSGLPSGSGGRGTAPCPEGVGGRHAE